MNFNNFDTISIILAANFSSAHDSFGLGFGAIDFNLTGWDFVDVNVTDRAFVVVVRANDKMR